MGSRSRWSTYFEAKTVLRSGNDPIGKIGGSSSDIGNEPGWDNASSTSSMLLSDGDIASTTSAGGICMSRRPLRSVDAIKHNSSIGSSECLSLSRQDIASSWLCMRSQSMLFRTASWDVWMVSRSRLIACVRLSVALTVSYWQMALRR